LIDWGRQSTSGLTMLTEMKVALAADKARITIDSCASKLECPCNNIPSRWWVGYTFSTKFYYPSIDHIYIQTIDFLVVLDSCLKKFFLEQYTNEAAIW